MESEAYLKKMGAKIKATRNKHGVSLRKLSKLCNSDMSNLCRIENGQINPQVLTLKSIADVFKMDVKDFL